MSQTVYEPDPHQPNEGSSPRTVFEPPGPALADPANGGAGGTGGARRLRLPPEITDVYEYLADIPTNGAQADIVHGRERATGREVAIKVYRGGAVGLDRSVIEELQAAQARNPDHCRHVVEIIDFHDGDWIYEVQEFFPLRSLQDCFDTPGTLPVSREQGAAMLVDVAAAVAYTHAINIRHRDLKPANILVRSFEPFDAVLADFGVAKAQQLTTVGGRVGTVPYLAPEATVGQSGRAGDWWSVGVIMAEAMTGRHLFGDGHGGYLPDDIIRVQLNQNTYVVPDLGDDRWNSLIRGLLTHSSSHRFGEAEVNDWLAGNNPTVWIPPSPAQATVAPYIFHGRECSSLAELGDGVRAHSAEALRLLAEPERRQERARLRDWLAKNGMAEGDLNTLVPIEAGSAPLSARVRLLRLQVRLDPGNPPVFDGTPLDGRGLSSQIAAAQGTGEQARLAQGWITRLRNDQVLAELSDLLPDATRLGLAGDRLARWWDRLLRAPAAQVREVTELHGALEAALLQSALSDDRAAVLDRRARAELARRSNLAPWSRALVEAAAAEPPEDGFGLRVAVLLAVPPQRSAERARRRQAYLAALRGNAWRGLRVWFSAAIPLMVLSVLGSTMAFQASLDRTLLAEWGLVIVIGTVISAVSPAFLRSSSAPPGVLPPLSKRPATVIMAAGLIWQFPVMASAAAAQRPGLTAWTPLVWWFLGAGVVGQALGFLPTAQRPLGRGQRAGRRLARGGLGLAGAALAAHAIGPAVGRLSESTVAEVSLSVITAYQTVTRWLAPVAGAQPAWSLPQGAWLAYLGTAVSVLVLPRIPKVPPRVTAWAGVATGLWAVFIVLGNVHVLLAPSLVVGGVLATLVLLAGIGWFSVAMFS